MAPNKPTTNSQVNNVQKPNFVVMGEVGSHGSGSMQSQDRSVPPSQTQVNPFDKVLAEIAALRSENNIIMKNQSNLEIKCDAMIKSSASIIHKLQLENSELRQKLNFLERENELRYRESHFQNLILVGLKDDEEENTNNLILKIQQILLDISSNQIAIDTVYRIGKFTSDRQRSVRIRFMSHSDRNKALENSENLPENIYLNEDLPYTIRRDNRLFRNKRSELFNLGVNFQTDWKNKVITTNDGRKISISDGKFITKMQHIHPETEPVPEDFMEQDQTPEGPIAKKSKNGEASDSQRVLRSNSGNVVISEVPPPEKGARGASGRGGGRNFRGNRRLT